MNLNLISVERGSIQPNRFEIRNTLIILILPEVPIPSFHEVSMSRQALVWRDWPNTGSAQDTMMLRVELREVVMIWMDVN